MILMGWNFRATIIILHTQPYSSHCHCQRKLTFIDKPSIKWWATKLRTYNIPLATKSPSLGIRQPCKLWFSRCPLGWSMMKHDLPQIITRGYGWRPRARDSFWSGSLIFEFSSWNYSEVCLLISKRVINSPTHHLSVPHEHEELTTLDVSITFTIPSSFCFMSRNHIIYKDCDGKVSAVFFRIFISCIPL